ncbi:LysM peptidoglycan-binding domain-containing protein [Paenibacillus sp. J5C_2022]|uniref:LysM peptidoglycan-binding domain-containing protein n=1 Tax=Paenibacillus sp. J5C2022 TaxID=2977129 RepID=UPI0021CED3AA|nr:LysM peptidoglycan-binding domain-containing protein [Paenibacillus sp. J5C2022]MCU6711083.1 LysM peptidoglycan-binding domain-containing protein [Paenibacillus sp. J5C2022]
MSNGMNGLRFDVYERVHMPDDVAAIDELEEIELVPRIQVIDQGDQAVLKGQLLLSGVYRGQNAADGPLTLEHWIPVEISLPMNRVSRLDDISIEIDNFDVDLLSARTLNITGVLSLRGIAMEPPQEEQGGWEEDAFTAVHEREQKQWDMSQVSDVADEEVNATYIVDRGAQSAEDYTAGEAEAEQEVTMEAQAAEEPGEQYYEGQTERESDQASSSSWEYQPIQQPEAGQSYSNEKVAARQPFLDTAEASEAVEAAIQDEGHQAEEPESHQEQAQHDGYALLEKERQEDEDASDLSQPSAFAAEQEPLPAEPVKPEVQIAFSGKSPERSDGSPEVGIRSLLQSSQRERAVREAAEQSQVEQEAERAEAVQEAEEEIEWKRLFLSKQEGDSEFRKIRMCIVQREETLEEIATRYSLNPREILVHNGLHESAIEEGQVLYIP